MNNQPIGIFDSGVGGLTVYKEIVALLPHESMTYLADSKNTPYGEKSSKEIYPLAKRTVEFLLEEKAKLIVIACNAITVSCLDRLREEYPHIPIVGTIPVIKTAASVTENKCIGILSTTRTASSTYQKNLIKTFANKCTVINLGTDELVPLIEQGEVANEKIHKVLEKILLPFQQEKIDTLALGCTHFPFLTPVMRDILGPRVKILDSGAAIARQVKRVLENNKLSISKNPQYTFYTTGDTHILTQFIEKENLSHGMIQSVVI